MQQVFEKYLSRKILKKRLIVLLFAIVFIAAAILCHHFAESTKEIVNIPVGDTEHYKTREVYQEWMIFLLIACAVLSMVSFVVLLSDLFLCRFKTLQKGDQYVTVYRGIIYNIVYVDWVEKGRIIPLPGANIVEVWLHERVRVTVHFTRSCFNFAYVSFSDHTATIEL